MKQWRNL